MQTLSIDQVAERLGINSMTVRRMVARDEFIKPIQIAPRCVRFSEGELVTWLATRPRGHLPQPDALIRLA